MTWTTEQLFADISTDALSHIFDITFFRNALLGLLVLSLAYPLSHYILKRISKKYQDLDNNVQNTVLQHFVEAAFLTVSLPGVTYLFLCFSFEEPHDDDGAMSLKSIHKFKALLVFIFMLPAMYLVEIVLRYRRLNPLVLVHHMCTITLMIASTTFPSALFFKINISLVYFAMYEVLTFYGLIMKVLSPFDKTTPRMMVAGMILFGITRPIQLVWILVIMIGSWEDHVMWQAMFQIVVTIAIQVAQCFALKIHYAVWRRCIERQIAKNVSGTSDINKTKHETVLNTV